MIYVLYIILGAAFILNTLFGLGPVLLADGVFSERMLTLAAVVLIYALLIYLFVKVRRRFKKSGR